MKIELSLVSLFLSAVVAFAETTVSDVSVHQLWPWSEEVDIAYTVSGDGADLPLKFTAQYDGGEPFVLAEKDLSGDFFDATKVGRHHVRWSPKRAGLGAKPLFNFRILSAVPDESVGTRTYLVLDLTTGDYTYMDAEPEGGWTSDVSYCQTKMVFRRIPSGTKTLGLSAGLRTLSGATDNYCKEHEATISADYYMGVFPVTWAQHDKVVSGKQSLGSYGLLVHQSAYSYNDIRGSKDEGFDWPNTGYQVRTNSYVAAFRKVAKLPYEWMIDLPTVAQWNYAARATTPNTQLWSVGGVVGDSAETLNGLLDQIATWEHNIKEYDLSVGQHKPNGWGLYDIIGLTYEWNLDWYGNDAAYYSGTDPIGPSSGSYRSRRSANDTYTAVSASKGYKFLTTTAIGTNGGESMHNYRLCIHTKRLVK